MSNDATLYVWAHMAVYACVCMCMHVYACVCMLSDYAGKPSGSLSMRASVNVCIYACMYVCMYVCIEQAMYL
jgi:hypothetical protein